MDNKNNINELLNSYFKVQNTTIDHMKELLHDIKWSKHDELKSRINELEQELENLKNTKKYWLVWDTEKEPEQVVLDCQKKLPILKEIKNRKIINDDSWESNLLIEWDNYHALQVLNYTHREAIDVIYIDPPYNTWNKDFVYNDKYIDKEDTYRHSKWLNFMEKRLKLANDLLKDDWVIFISIDDNEQAQLKLICDEVFWEDNFLNKLIWKKQNWWKQDAKFLANNYEYVYIYRKSENKLKFNRYNPSENLYKYVDENWRFFNRKHTVDSQNFTYSKSLDYTILSPENTIIYAWNVSEEEYLKRKSWWGNKKNWCWTLSETEFLKRKEEWKIEFLKNKDWNYRIYKRVYMDESIWVVYDNYFDGANTWSWSRELKSIFWDVNFPYPKPKELIQYLLNLFDKDNLIILDFMAWSWTTWHAVLDLNKEDWGNRKFILCTNNENNICEEITYERIKRVSNWYTNSKWKEVESLGWNLRYYKTEFVEVENLKEITDQKKLELTYNAWELLAIKEWIYNELEKNDYWQIFESKKDIVAIYFKESSRKIEEMKDRLIEIQKQKKWKVKWYIYNNPFEKTMFSDIKKLELKDIPDPILKVYREINKV